MIDIMALPTWTNSDGTGSSVWSYPPVRNRNGVWPLSDASLQQARSATGSTVRVFVIDDPAWKTIVKIAPGEEVNG